MLLIISTMALGPEPPVEAGAGSACKNIKRAAVNAAFTSVFTVSDAVTPTKLPTWCALELTALKSQQTPLSS
jgi:hypothetical protein